jgi:hypothetical protein
MRGKLCKIWIMLLLFLLCLFPVFSASAAVLTTLYGANASSLGFMFDLEAIGGDELVIESFDINLTDGNNPATIRLYYREGGYTGFETTPSAWTLYGSAVVTAMGKDGVTHLPIGGLRLTAGKTYGIYMVAEDADGVPRFRYTTTVTSPVYQDGMLRLSGGSGIGPDIFAGNIYHPRIWNGSIYYAKAEQAPATGDGAASLLWVWGFIALAAPVAALFIHKRVSRR